MISNPIFNSKPATNGTISKVSSASPSSDEEALSNLTGTIEIKGQNGLCSKLELEMSSLPNALVQRIETQYPTFRQWSSFTQLEPASRYKVFLRRYIYAWFLCVQGAVVFTFTYAAVGLTSSQIDGVLIFAITLWIGSAFGGCIGLCCLSQRFNILLESGLEDACDHLNNMKGVAFQCKKRKKEVVNGQGHEQTVDQIYIEGMYSHHSILPHIQRYTFDQHVLTTFQNFHFWVYFYAQYMLSQCPLLAVKCYTIRQQSVVMMGCLYQELCLQYYLIRCLIYIGMHSVKR